MYLLLDLQWQANFDTPKKISLLAAPSGLYDIDFDTNLLKEYYAAVCFREVKVSFDPAKLILLARIHKR